MYGTVQSVRYLKANYPYMYDVIACVADPDPGAGAFFLTLDPGSGMGKNQDLDLGSGMNIRDQ
jgi:hypothetical protein